MRIAIVSNTFPPEGRGGAEAYASRLTRELARRHEVLVLTGASQIDVDVPFVQIPHLPLLRGDETTTRKVVYVVRDQFRPPVHVALARELARFGPDFVHSFNAKGLSAAAFTGIARAGAPHVHTAQDLNLLCLRVTMTKDGDFCGGRCAPCLLHRTLTGRVAARSMTRFIGNSEYVTRRHVDSGVIAREIARAVPYGVDAGSTRLREPQDGALRLGFIGTLIEHKGIRTLLDVFSRTPRGWSLTVAGTGPLEPEVRAAAAADSRVRYEGYVQDEGKDRFLDSLDVLVVPSECEEGAGIVAIEAAVRGLPLAVSDRGGLLEAPEARVFKSGDKAALRDALDEYALDPGRLRATSERLLAQRERFLWATHVARIEQVYGEVAT